MLWLAHPTFCSESGDCGSSTSQDSDTSLRSQPLSPSGSAGVRFAVICGALGSTIRYVTDEVALRPPLSVYEQVASWLPMPSAAWSPATGPSVAAKLEGPSSASVTLQVAAGTEPLA